MELATATLLSAEQTEPAHHFRLVHWLIPILGKLVDLLECQPVTQKFNVCIMSKEENIAAAFCWQWHADPYLPSTFTIKGIGTDLLSAGSSVHILLPHGTYYPVSSRKVQSSWATDPAVQLPHGHSIIGQDWPESCSIGKWHPVKIEMSHLQFWLVPGLSLACPSEFTLYEHQAKGRQVAWGRWRREGREGHGLL